MSISIDRNERFVYIYAPTRPTYVMTSMTYIELSNISKKFGDFTAVHNLSFSAKQGEILGFLGPNGAGKTTTMRMITGYSTPTQGSIRILGHVLADNPILCKASIGYVPEGAPLYHELSPRMLLNFVACTRQLSKDFTQQRMEFVQEALHLKPVFDRPIETLSKGFKRRVGLAAAILHDPKILILDEPTDGLDPIQKHEVRQLIRSMAKDKAIIISTHILEEVQAVCHRVVIIHEGKMIADETPGQLQARYPGTLDDVFRHLITTATADHKD